MGFPKGFKSAAVKAGLKKDGYDLALITSTPASTASGVYTKNKTVAAPVTLCKKNDKNPISAIVINSKNANALTGKCGIMAAEKTASYTAEKLGVKSKNILVSSTGVIGVPLPLDKILKGLDEAFPLLKNGDNKASEAILTTDSGVKTSSISLTIDDKRVNVYAMGKGAGMIHPNMATMLVYILTDAAVEKKTQDAILKEAADCSFNRISVDGDTSTNDSLIMLSNALANNKPIDESHKGYMDFVKAIKKVCFDIAEKIVLDGEGATKLITIYVDGAKTKKDAHLIAGAIATSSLVKTAFYGGDGNWGRIISAAGASSASFNPNNASLSINGIEVFKNGEGTKYSEARLSKSLSKKRHTINLSLSNGKYSDFYIFSDLTHEYVSINADYRT